MPRVRGNESLRLVLFTVLLFVFTLTATITGFAPKAYAKPPQQRSMAEMWQDTGLRAAHVIAALSDQTCRRSIEFYLGCFYALQELAAWSDKKLVVTEDKIQVTAKKPDQKIEGETYYQKFQRKKEARFAEQQLLLKHYNMPGHGRISFPKNIKRFFELAAKPEFEGMMAANALNNMFHYSIDPHTNIMPTEMVMKDAKSGGENNYVGIGVQMFFADKKLLMTPMAGGAAEKAGLKNNDILTHVDGVDVSTLTPNEVQKLLLGEAGTKVTVTVQRDHQSSLDFDIIRAPVKINNVEFNTFKLNQLKYGYVSLKTFTNRKSCNDIEDAILKMTKSDRISGLVFDLRGNGGGDLAVANCIAGLFLPKDSVVTRLRSITNGSEVEVLKTETNPVTQLPLTVLIDAGSASASELVAGALQDHNRAWIVGERSFGKGTAQTVVPYLPEVFGDTMHIAVTQFTFHQPSGRTNQIHGIIPDFEVPYKPNATDEERFSMREIDIYENAIANTHGDWQSNREDDRQKLNAKLTGEAEKHYDAKATDHKRDYQLLKAAEVMSCDSLLILPRTLGQKPML